MILDQIITSRRKQVELLKAQQTIGEFERQIEESKLGYYSFKDALHAKEKQINIIAEVKKASPSKGLICKEFDPVKIAKAYEMGGAAAISVLTEPSFFQGRNEYLTQIKENVKLPLLRKDFVIDEIQIYEARAIGADGILLIVAALTDQELKAYLQKANELGLDALVETHDEEEVKRALEAGAEIIGVNNRDLRNFEVRLETSEKLSRLIPKDKVFVSESGVHTKEDVRRLKKIGANALLIGESVVKVADPVSALRNFMEE